MKYIATYDAINNLNENGITENDVKNEFQNYKDLENGKINAGQIKMNWKIKNLLISPIGEKTALIMVYGEELKKSYEDLPEIEYKENKWKIKVISEN